MPRCRVIKCLPPSASSPRSTSRRPASCCAVRTSECSESKPETKRNVLVTGGSRGLGLAIAQKLAAAGYTVIALARGKSKELTAAMAEADRDAAGALHFAPFDLGEIDKIPELVRGLRKEFGPLYGLVNNAAHRSRWRARDHA